MFENAQTLAGEHDIIKVAAEKWNCIYRKLPLKVCLDFVLERDGAFKAVVEVRDRNYSYEWLSENGGYMISVFKVERGFAYSALLRVPFVLIVRCEGGDIWHARLTSGAASEWKVAWFDGNRSFRREDDREPVFLIPMSVFARLNG